MEHESCDYCYEQLRPVAYMRAVGFTEHDGRTAPLVKVWCGALRDGRRHRPRGCASTQGRIQGRPMTTPAPHPNPAAPSVRHEGETMTAQKLRDAAKVLRESAESASGESVPPWHIEGGAAEFTTVIDDHGWRVTEGPDQYYREVAAYIATMHPGVGLALADWLDIGATNAEKNGWQPGYLEALEHTPALRIADLILGGAA